MNQSLSLIFAFQKGQACGTVHAETRGYMSSKQVSGQEKKRDRLRETQLLLLERGWYKNVWLWEDPGKPLKHSKKNNKVPYPWIQFWEPLPAQKVGSWEKEKRQTGSGLVSTLEQIFDICVLYRNRV